MGVHVAHSFDRNVVYRGLVGKSEENRKLGRIGRRWEDNIQRDIQKVQWGRGFRLNWSAQDKDRCWRAIVNVVIFHIRELGNIYTYITSLKQRTHTDKICFYHTLKFTHIFRQILWSSSSCLTTILIKYNIGQLLYFTSILVTHAKAAKTWGWILIYDKNIHCQCAFVGLLHNR